jgi:hypothetical protein
MNRSTGHKENPALHVFGMWAMCEILCYHRGADNAAGAMEAYMYTSVH